MFLADELHKVTWEIWECLISLEGMVSVIDVMKKLYQVDQMVFIWFAGRISVG